ncbi:putative spermidine/putrescine transport system ATP-binding protein/spermidine/putrescine transport system ATP-binding protein [Nocardioides luteus]|uniref:Spermidine/putrescine import ATP-binding protein PotA n=1 Tax=Nocardioides luteus TaxID=1844 RepID=A0ABQ5SSG8_9ACTN|nr:ABC transporter ATP-binding protein [Nocardioides luteus]MDR7311359.1 putative spermidine/putrescine transport system ATP-binding protein/spermidine/putrescine transport system ATP-binding protein [Nocardioides luteus]GGR65395.1 polyamine-transporting ATPase [Nocardioides luteus]GLJ66864.1 polyamine-transporting ATPase [Nocardioides luteus]
MTTKASPDLPSGSVRISGLTKTYGQATAVDGLDLEIRAGEFISLLGPSGCGKTTTLRLIAGFEKPDSGSVLIGGKDVVRLAPYQRDVNTVFQAYALFPHKSVAENVAYGLQQRKTPRAEIRERVVEALRMVRMLDFADRSPTQLSGGQQQRVALARALVNRPGVLLLDEPLGALDRQLREEMQLELKLLQSRLGITFVFVTHDQGEALAMSDRIAIMRAGRIEQLADAETVYNQPASAYVAGFVGQQNFLDGEVSADGTTVETPLGTIEGPAKPDGKPGEPHQAAVRPELIAIEPGTVTEARNSVAGEVLQVSLLGEVIQYLVRVTGETSLLVRRPTHGAVRLSPGNRVVCGWAAEDVRLFPLGAPPDPSTARSPQ